MNSLIHNEKRQIFEQHFLFGKLSTDEIDPLIGYTGSNSIQPAAKFSTKGRPAKA